MWWRSLVCFSDKVQSTTLANNNPDDTRHETEKMKKKTEKMKKKTEKMREVGACSIDLNQPGTPVLTWDAGARSRYPNRYESQRHADHFEVCWISLKVAVQPIFKPPSALSLRTILCKLCHRSPFPGPPASDLGTRSAHPASRPAGLHLGRGTGSPTQGGIARGSQQLEAHGVLDQWASPVGPAGMRHTEPCPKDIPHPHCALQPSQFYTIQHPPQW